MQLKNTIELLDSLQSMEMPVTNTTRGEQIQQTFRNNLTAKLKEALYEDCKSYYNSNKDGILAYRTKEGVILEIPNDSIADAISNEFGSGALSIELKFTIKGLEYNAAEMAEEYDISMRTKEEKKKDAERKKAAKIQKDSEARRARELKRAKMLAEYLRENDN